MSRVAVAKMHGAGNDFIVIDARAAAPADPDGFARRYCARRTGIGADGVLLIEAGMTMPRMRIVNADGSEAQMCGNGIRCVAAYLDALGERPQSLETPSGEVPLTVLERGETYIVRAAMPVLSVERYAEGTLRGIYVDTGNPHVVFPSGESAIESIAGRVNASDRFPSGANVHVSTRLSSTRIAVVHYERGAGRTLACGSGAVASAVAAMSFGDGADRLHVDVPGGSLIVEWDGGPVAFLTGPAVRVFETEVAWP